MNEAAETANRTGRYGYVDYAKALGMLAVIWGHIHLAGPTHVIVYAFDIPMFFFLSGMMYKNEKYDTLWKLVKSRAKSLLLPYVIFSVVTWAVWVAYNLVLHNDVEILPPLLETFIARGSAGYMVHDVPLWFVTCLFVVEILYWFISRLPDILNVVVCAGCAAIGWLMLNNGLDFDFTGLPWNIESAMSAILFYSLGNVFAVRLGTGYVPGFVRRRPWLSAALTALLTGLFVIGGLYNGHVSIGSNLLGKSVVLFYAVGLCGTMSTLLASGLIDLAAAESSCRFIRALFGGLRRLGRGSFYFMAVHVPVKGVLIAILAKLMRVRGTDVEQSFPKSLIAFILTLICSCVAVWFINTFVNRLCRRDKK